MQSHIQGFIACAFSLIGSAGLSFIARMERPPFHHGGSASTETMSAVSPFSFQSRSISLQGWGLTDLPLRASNEGLRRPRVARAQKIISLHPFLPLVPQSSPRNSAFSFLLVMVRIMDLLPLFFLSRQHPVVEIEPLIREGFQKLHLGAGPF
jgi:hypothetical protein